MSAVWFAWQQHLFFSLCMVQIQYLSSCHAPPGTLLGIFKFFFLGGLFPTPGHTKRDNSPPPNPWSRVCTVLKSPWILGEGLKKSLNSIFPLKLLKFLCKSLKSPWILFNFERSGLESVFWCFLVVQDRI